MPPKKSEYKNKISLDLDKSNIVILRYGKNEPPLLVLFFSTINISTFFFMNCFHYFSITN